jgi:hypothetical protein
MRAVTASLIVHAVAGAAVGLVGIYGTSRSSRSVASQGPAPVPIELLRPAPSGPLPTIAVALQPRRPPRSPIRERAAPIALDARLPERSRAEPPVQRRADLTLPAATLDRLAVAAPRPLDGPRRLEQRGRTHAIADDVVPMTVAPDGTPTIHQRSNLKVNLIGVLRLIVAPRETARAFGQLLSAWYADPYAATRVGRPQDLPAHEQAVPGGWDSLAGGDGGLLGGTFDLTDALAKRLGAGDPYASRKLALLDSTRAERADLGGKYRAAQLARSAELVQRALEAMWRTLPDAATRRDALFALWDECLEGDDPEGAAGDRARAMVIGWIRARLPVGSSGAFTSEELAERNRTRNSRQRFEPY